MLNAALYPTATELELDDGSAVAADKSISRRIYLTLSGKSLTSKSVIDFAPDAEHDFTLDALIYFGYSGCCSIGKLLIKLVFLTISRIMAISAGVRVGLARIELITSGEQANGT